MNITTNIKAANQWLAANRPGTKPITWADVTKRWLSSSSLLSVESDAKTTKGSAKGYLTGILYLAPHSITGFNLCPAAVTCQNDCLFNAGRGSFGNVSRSRIVKTLMFLEDPSLFQVLLARDIKRLVAKAKKTGQKPVVRINGTSDLVVERTFGFLLKAFPNVQFYDYTKMAWRFRKALPANYHLTFSYDGTNPADVMRLSGQGHNSTVVFNSDTLPSHYFGIPVIDGDKTDLRFTDPKGVIVGLRLKAPSNDARDNANNLFVREA